MFQQNKNKMYLLEYITKFIQSKASQFLHDSFIYAIKDPTRNPTA